MPSFANDVEGNVLMIPRVKIDSKDKYLCPEEGCTHECMASAQIVRKHLFSHHAPRYNNYGTSCNTCGKLYVGTHSCPATRPEGLRALRGQGPRSLGIYKCGICQAEFTNGTALSNHKTRIHRQWKYSVDIDDDRGLGTTEDSVAVVVDDVDELEEGSDNEQDHTPPQKRMKTDSVETYPIQCWMCENTFDWFHRGRKNLLEHLVTAHGSPYHIEDAEKLTSKCLTCDKKFSKPFLLYRHLNAMHDAKFPAICTQVCGGCSKAFASVKQWQTHLVSGCTA